MSSKKWINLVLIFFISAVAFHMWLSFDKFFFADWDFFYSDKLAEMSYPSAWLGDVRLGETDIILWAYPRKYISGIFGNFGFDWSVADKFIILWPIVFLLPLACFLILDKIFKKAIPVFVGTMYFSLSSYFLASATQGHQFLTGGAIWGVFALYFCMLLVEKKHIKWAVFAGIMLALAGYYDFRMAYIFFFVCGGFLFVSWVGEVRRLYRIVWFTRNDSDRTGLTCPAELASDGPRRGLLAKTEGEGEAKKIFWMSGVFVTIFVGLNIFWILPFAVSGTATSENSALGRDLFGNDYFELDDAMYLSHPFWTGYGVKWFSDQPTPWWLTLLTILVWIGFWVGVRGERNEKLIMKNEELGMKKREEEGKEMMDLRLRGGESEGTEGEKEGAEGENEMRRRKYILFFAFVALIGILLGKQVSEPFPTLYYWLYENIPGFNAFREASKFYVLIALGYAVGIASLVEWLLPKEEGKKD